MSKSSSPRVRMCPHLSRQHLTLPENILFVEQGGAWHEVAYATHVRLENVKPVIDEAIRRSIVKDKSNHRHYSGWLEGDLIAWRGRLNSDAPEGLHEVVTHTQQARPLKILKEHKPDQQTSISYNPRRYGCFYAGTGDRHRDQACDSADAVTAIHWHYGTENPQLRPLKREETEIHRRPKTGFEEKEWNRGLIATQNELKKLSNNVSHTRFH